MVSEKFKTLRDITDNSMSSVQKTEFHRLMFPDHVSRNTYNLIREKEILELPGKHVLHICKAISTVKDIDFRVSDLYKFDPQNKLSSVVAA